MIYAFGQELILTISLVHGNQILPRKEIIPPPLRSNKKKYV